jgi:hypothetical protein
MLRHSKGLIGLTAAAALFSFSSFADAQDAPRKVRVLINEEREETIAPQGEVRFVPAVPTTSAAELKVRQSKFWIGAGCSPLSELVKAQLQLERGVEVRSVAEKSPAAAAGIAPHDILLALDDYQLHSLEDLVDAVEKVGANEATLLVLREGEERKVKITPAARPVEAITTENNVVVAPPGAAHRDVLRAIERLRDEQLKSGDPTWEMMLLRPGAVVPFQPREALQLPENVSVTIRKQADQPAQIEIQRGDEKWNVTEDKLSELPPEVQALVGRLRVAQPTGAAVFAMPHGIRATPAAPGTPQVRVVKPLATPVPPDVQAVMQKLDEVLEAVRSKPSANVDQLEKEVDRLRRDVEELKKSLDKQR